MKEKTFLNWRFNLRHVTMLLMALFLCVGNAWGADYYYTHLYMSETHTNGKVYMATSASNPSNTNSFKYALSSTANHKTRSTQTQSGETYYYIYAYPDANCHFVEFQVVGDVTCNGTCVIETPTTETLSNNAVVKKARVVMTSPIVANVLDQSTYATAYVRAVFAPDATGNDITYSVAVFNESGTATSIGNDATVRYTASSNTEGNYPLNYVYTYGTEAAVKNTSTTEQITLSMPHKAAPDNAYLDLPRGYNFKGWYNSSTAGTYTAVSTNDSYTTTFATANYAGARIEKKATHSVTIDSPTHGSLTVTDIEDANKSTISDKATLIASNPMSIYKDDKLTFSATPADGYYFYRWYYRKNNATRVTFEPTSNTFTLPDNGTATAIGVEFKRKVDFQITSYSSIFTESDYELGVRNETTSDYKKLVPETTGTTSFSLFEGDNVTLVLKLATSTTRGVKFKRWYCQLGEEKFTISAEKEFAITYAQLAAIAAQYPEETILFGVDTELKDTYTFKFVQNQYGSYNVKYYDENSSASYAYNTGEQFTVAKGSGETSKTLYEGDGIKLEYTSSNESNTTSGYLFHSWYWEDEDGNQSQLGDGVVTVVDTVLPEEAIKLGANFVTVQKGDITFLSNAQGTYKVDAVTYGTSKAKAKITVPTSGNSTIQNVLLTSPLKLYKPVCSDPENYAFYRWYYITSESSIPKTLTYLEDSINVILPENTVSVGMEFQPIGDFSVNGLYFNDLADAIQAAQSEVSKSGSATIVVARDATVGAGNYTVPANVTILIPYKDGQVNPSNLQVIAKTEDYVGAYRTLTLANGAHLEVYGTIEVSGFQTTGGYDGQGNDVPSRTGGPYYGKMHMSGGSSITMNNGSKLYAWGYVTGDRNANGEYTCEIDVRRGATAYEHFQIADWKGAFPTVEITSYANENAYHVLPICQYYIQNIEVPARYRPGSRLLGAAAINVDLLDNHNKSYGITFAMNNAGLVGIKYPEDPDHSDNAVFLLNDADNSEDTWVRKFYDPATDQQVYEINNSADVGSLVMFVTIKGIGDVLGRPKNMDNRDRINVDSRAYQFPIMNNFKMHLLSGDLYVTQRTEILPGAVIEIDKKATMTINNNKTNKTPNDIALLFYDAEDWGPYIYQNITGAGERSWGYGSKVKYRPDGVPNVRNISTKTGQGNSQLIVHGTVDVKGELYTTSHGASITSTIDDAGTIIFSNAAPASVGPTFQVDSISSGNNPSFDTIPRVPALLRNDSNNTAYGATTPTASTPKDTSYCFIDMNGDGKGEWINLANDGCFVRDQYGNYYAKPQEYVALANGKTANADHTYSDAAGQGRLFILVDDCQWWEVEKKDNLYHCTNPDNDTYYYWDDGDKDESKHQWREKEFQVYWKNWNGDPLGVEDNDVVYNLNYGVTPKYLEEGNPKRADDVDYTYNFIGWTPEIVPVTGNATYTAVYEAIQKKYTIIFNDADGNEIKRQQLALGESPSAPDISSIENSYWDPAIAVVSGNATYTLKTYDEEPEEFTVTWANYNGSTISSEQVTKYDKPVYSGSTPVKNLNNEYNYTWTGWQSPAGTYDTDDELPAVEANITYTATFSVEPKTHAIKFYQEDGTTQIGTTQNLAFGADPVIPNYSKAATAQYTYTLKWLDKDFASEDPEDYELAASVNVPSVTADASYKAYFTETLNKYTVTLQSNLPGKCSFTGAGTYDYNTNVTIAATPAEGYEFVKWIEREGDANLGTLPLTSDITLTAVLKESAAATPENLNVNNGEINVPAAANYMDLTIFSDGAEASGQLTGATNVTLLGNANFVFKKNIKAGYWYSFAVPWRVDAQSGVYFGGLNTPAVLGKDFEIVYYDGAVRAAQGKVDACWVYLKNLSTKKILEPGKAYMIFIKHGSQSQIVFRKKVQEPLLTTSVTVEQYNASDVLNANWNAIANPALYSAYVYAGDSDPKGYYYISENDQFDWYHLNVEKLVVGEAVYIQAPEAGTIVVNNSSYAPVAAPRRERAEQATSFDVQIAAAGATKRADHISIQIDEDKEENKYVIGKDLTKFGVSARVAQMWIDRYDVKLCFNTIAPEGDATYFPMNIYAPKAGTYTIAIEREVATEDYALYLTYNGEAIWNLSDGAYTANLNKGTDANYGLRISAKAPQVVTGVDEAIVDAQGETRKVLINNQVFIIRGEKVYTIDGQLVK